MNSAHYFLQVVKDGQEPRWPIPSQELNISSCPVGGGLTQYWAYPKTSGVAAETVPHAQALAAQVGVSKAVILIDQPGELELILVKDNVAFAKTESNLANLEDNLSSILEFGQKQFNIRVGDFMTTSRVAADVEKKLDELEESETSENQPENSTREGEPEEIMESVETVSSDEATEQAETPAPTERADSFRNLSSSDPSRVFRSDSTIGSLNNTKSSSSPNFRWLIIIILLLILAGAGYYFRGIVTSRLNQPEEQVVEPTSTPEPTPELETFDRSSYQLRVLNGTLTSGAAKSLGDSLQGQGWKILKVGNATSSANPQTYVKVKKDGEKLASKLIEDLSKDYEATRSASDLKTDDEADAEVVIGKK